MAAEPANTYVPNPHLPRVNKLGEWLCRNCGGQDFRLSKHEKGSIRLFTIRCANCRREAGTGFPC